jgi:hypothetical protein
LPNSRDGRHRLEEPRSTPGDAEGWKQPSTATNHHRHRATHQRTSTALRPRDRSAHKRKVDRGRQPPQTTARLASGVASRDQIHPWHLVRRRLAPRTDSHQQATTAHIADPRSPTTAFYTHETCCQAPEATSPCRPPRGTTTPRPRHSPPSTIPPRNNDAVH